MYTNVYNVIYYYLGTGYGYGPVPAGGFAGPGADFFHGP